MANTPSADSETTGHDLKLRELEIARLEVELEHLRRPLYRQPTVIFGAVGALVAIATLGLKVWDQYRENRALTSNAEALRVENSDLHTSKESLETDIRRLRSTEAELRSTLEELDDERGILDHQLATTRAEIEEKTRELNRLVAQLHRYRELLPSVPADVTAELDPIPESDLSACDLSEDGVFVAVGQAGIVRITDDAGASWRHHRIEDALLRSVDMSSDGGTVCVGAHDGRVFLSTDQGATFAAAPLPAFVGPVRAIGVSPRGSTLAARTDRLLARSVDHGTTWDTVEIPEGRPVPAGSILTADDGAVTVMLNRVTRGRPSEPGRPPPPGEVEVVALTYAAMTLDDPQEKVIRTRRSGLLTSVCSSTTAGTMIAVWNIGQPEYRGQLLTATHEGWTTLAASNVPEFQSIWCSADRKQVVGVTRDGGLHRADHLSRWVVTAGLPRVTAVAGAPDGSVLWAIGNRGAVLRRTSATSAWEVVPIEE
jgi:hypothetical protein